MLFKAERHGNIVSRILAYQVELCGLVNIDMVIWRHIIDIKRHYFFHYTHFGYFWYNKHIKARKVSTTHQIESKP